MEAKNTFSILFWIAKNRIKNDKAPISCRVTVNGQRAELSAQKDVGVLDWDEKAQIVIGRNQEAKEINNHLAMIKVKLSNCQSKLEARSVIITLLPKISILSPAITFREMPKPVLLLLPLSLYSFWLLAASKEASGGLLPMPLSLV